MKKMILGFILGLVVAGGIGVLAYTINAKQISYTPKDTTWKNTNGENITNVEDAINSLKSTKIMNFGESIYARSAGCTTSPARKATINLDKGNYLIVANYSLSSGTSHTRNNDNDNTINITCSNCEQKVLASRYSSINSTNKPFSSDSQYVTNDLYSSLYKVNILEDNTDIVASSVLDGNYNYLAENVLLQAIPLD